MLWARVNPAMVGAEYRCRIDGLINLSPWYVKVDIITHRHHCSVGFILSTSCSGAQETRALLHWPWLVCVFVALTKNLRAEDTEGCRHQLHRWRHTCGIFHACPRDLGVSEACNDNLPCTEVEFALWCTHTAALAYLCLQVWLTSIAVDFQIV